MPNVFGQDLPEEIIAAIRERASKKGTTLQDEAEAEAQRRSFARGNLKLSGKDEAAALVDEIADAEA